MEVKDVVNFSFIHSLCFKWKLNVFLFALLPFFQHSNSGLVGMMGKKWWKKRKNKTLLWLWLNMDDHYYMRRGKKQNRTEKSTLVEIIIKNQSKIFIQFEFVYLMRWFVIEFIAAADDNNYKNGHDKFGIRI